MVAALTEESSKAIPILGVAPTRFAAWLAERDDAERRWIEANAFKAEAGKTLLIPGADGSIARIIHGLDSEHPVWSLAGLPERLPEGTYRLDFDVEAALGDGSASRVALGWALGAYAFTRYKARSEGFAQLVWPKGADRQEVAALADGVALTRDLVNTPAEDMGPAALEAAARQLAETHGATIESITGDDLLTQNYPLIHAVGRAAAGAPRLIDLRWGDPGAPKLTLVGKGVIFDSGGLDIKTAGGMKLMKKDMGGAATLIGLAHSLMAAGAPVRLRLLVPAVENAISGNAFRPMDIFRGRKGLTVEIGNTDAEGRLVLSDALTEAASENPALLIDVATLTGAARVALGPDLPALFANDDASAAALIAAGTAEDDPLWRLPLWKPYKKYLKSNIADLNNASDSGYAGAITAALFLQEFVPAEIPWLHIDSFAWNPTARPGRPEGGEALTLRALYRMIRERFG